MKCYSVDLNYKGATLNCYVPDTIPYVRKAILVMPGGGYSIVCSEREGEPIAHSFIPHGFAAFVLNYSVNRTASYPTQLIQASLAMKYIRDNAKELNINPEEVYTVGFSAGGHLAGCLATMWHKKEIYNAVNMPYGYNKPTGAMLIYPVINDHFGSFANLYCRDNITKEEIEALSIDKNVDEKTCPIFLAHTATDNCVPIANTIDMAYALSKNNIFFETHIFPYGSHGLATGDPVTIWYKEIKYGNDFSSWVDLAVKWVDKF